MFSNQRKGYAKALDTSRCASPHYSRRLPLQPSIRKSELIAVFFLRARIILRALDLASAVTTHLTAGGLAAQSVNILFKYASLLRDSARPSRVASRRFRHELSRIMRARFVSERNSWGDRSSRRTSGSGTRCHDPPPAYLGSFRPSLAKGEGKSERGLE